MIWYRLIFRTMTGKNPNSYYDKDTLRMIRIFCAAAMIVAILCMAMNREDEFKEWMIEENAEIQISADALGFSSNASIKASLMSLTCNTEKIGTGYHVEYDEAGKTLEITVYQLNQKEIVHAAFMDRVEKRASSQNKGYYGRNHYRPKVKYERLVQTMTPLNAEEWDASIVCALNSLDSLNNILFVEKQNQIAVVEVAGLQFSSELLSALKEALHKIVIQNESE